MMSMGTKPAQLFTPLGTRLYIDIVSGELKHGWPDETPFNVVLILDPAAALSGRYARIVFQQDNSRHSILATSDCCYVAEKSDGTENQGYQIEIVPLERGLLGLRCGELFFCAEPDWRITCSRPWCSTWECFLASEDWCGARSLHDVPTAANIDKRLIADIAVDPRLRARINSG